MSTAIAQTDAARFSLSWPHSVLDPKYCFSCFCLKNCPKFTGLKQNSYLLNILQSGLSSAGHFFWTHLASFTQLQTWRLRWGCHQSRLYPHVWRLSQSGRNSRATAGHVLPPWSLSGTLAAPVYTAPLGSTRAKAGTSAFSPVQGPGAAPLCPSKCHGLSNPGQGECPPPAHSDRACGAHLYSTTVPLKGATRLAASHQK